jgi:hypothetical protein
MRHLSVGALIEEQQAHLLDTSDRPGELWKNYRSEYRTTAVRYARAQAVAIAQSGNSEPMLAERTILYAALMDELVCVPAFANRKYLGVDSLATRTDLIESNGIFGRITELTEELLAQHDQQNDSDETSARIGLINEMTALGLGSLPQDPDMVLLPSLPLDDRWHGIDLTAYVNDGRRTSLNHYQVKSYERYVKPPLKHVGIIGGIAMGNSSYPRDWRPREESLQTAGAMVELTRGVLSSNREATLRGISDRLVQSVRNGGNFADL